jgi:hypothetical protein
MAGDFPSDMAFAKKASIREILIKPKDDVNEISLKKINAC